MLAKQVLIQCTQAVLTVVFSVLDLSLWFPFSLYQWVQRQLSILLHTNSNNNDNDKSKKKTVVIVGGSFAGLTVLRELQHHSHLHIVLIDSKEYFEYTPGVLRLFCQPDLFSSLAHRLPESISYEVICGTVTRADHQTVTYEPSHEHTNGSQSQQPCVRSFDYLVWATGSSYSYPISAHSTETTLQSRAQGWRAAAQRVREARSILILGGGAVGTELAAEIVSAYGKTKDVTLVDASPSLVPLFPKHASRYAHMWLQSRGVHLRLGQKLKSWDEKSCTLANGKVLVANLVFVCFGDQPNSAPLVRHPHHALTNGNRDNSNHLPPPVELNARKCVTVDDCLRVPGRPHVFSCGDVAAPPREGVKQAYHAEVMGHLVAQNILRQETGQKLLRYPNGASGTDTLPLVFVLSLGPWDGVLGFNELCIPGALASIVKWVIEWTKIRQMLGRPVGILIWILGDAVSFFLSRTLLPPRKKTA